MGRNAIETIMGGVVLMVAGGFLLFAYERSTVKTVDGYNITARFNDISGISVGSEVRISGLKVGVVDDLILNAGTYQADASLMIKEDIKLPKDTSAAIVSTGLLGDKYIKLDPGGDNAMLKQGDEIRFTQSSISFEELIGKFMFSGGGVEEIPESDDGLVPETENPFSLELELE